MKVVTSIFARQSSNFLAMTRLAMCELLVVCCIFILSSVISQETSHAKYEMPQERPSEFTFFFRNDQRRPAQNPSENPMMLTTTPFPQTSTTQKEFTGIAFPPQIFEILTGSEPSTQNLGGRKNATLLLMINTTDNQEPNLQPPQNIQPVPPQQQFSTNSTQLPEIINGATRPPTRFPPGNKPSFVRPTHKPVTTTTQGYGQPNFGIYNNNNVRPQAGSMAAAPYTTTPAPDNRVGAPTTTTTRVPATQQPMRPRPPPSPPSTSRPLITGGQYGEPPLSPSFKYKDVLRSVKGITQYLQEALLTPSSKGVALWDGINSNFLLSPLGVGLTMAQMLMAGGTRAKSHLRDILRIHAKSDTNEQA
ncbi:hypothetical protein B566_EDAN006985 [Ephemera danica]|nr:hypothetical protein B566_EDAN006985 [Ephemera danica]